MSRFKYSTPLIELVESSSLTKKQIAERAGISRASLYNLLNGDVAECKLSTLVSLSAAMGIHPLEIIQPYIKNNLSLNQASKPSGTAFVEDVSYPDYSSVFPKEVFVKTWSVLNAGKMPWENLFLCCQDPPLHEFDENATFGLSPTLSKIPIPYTEPGQKVHLSVEFTAPDLPCTVISKWKTVNSNGELLFPDKKPLYCLVKVCSY